jgi:hypothetical protein
MCDNFEKIFVSFIYGTPLGRKEQYNFIMKRNKFIPVGDVTVRISNTERRNSLSNPRHCFTLSILNDDKNVLYRKDVVVHCDIVDAIDDDGLHMVIGKVLRNIERLVPQNKSEKVKFKDFIERLKDELYLYSERTRPVETLF